jgi:hypothetical protein
MRYFHYFLLAIVVPAACSACGCSRQKAERTEVHLIGSDWSSWRAPTGAWQLVGDVAQNPDNDSLLLAEPGSGTILNGPTGKTVDILSEQAFGDVAAHVEFMVPQGSNSGVYLMARYEIQIFDSYGKDPVTHSDCGGIYQRWDENRDPRGLKAILRA